MIALDKSLAKAAIFNQKFKDIDKQKDLLAKEFKTELRAAFGHFFKEVPAMDSFVVSFDTDENAYIFNNRASPIIINWFGFRPKSLLPKVDLDDDCYVIISEGFRVDYTRESFNKEFSKEDREKIKQIISFIKKNEDVIVHLFRKNEHVTFSRRGIRTK